MWLPGSLTSRGFPLGPVAAPPPARLCPRDALGSPGGRRPRNLWVALPGLMVGGGGPHTRCPALVLQVACQVGQRSIPCHFRVPPCLVGRHAVLLAGPFPCQVSPLVRVLLSVVGVPAFLPRPLGAPRVAVGLAVQTEGLHRSPVALPLGSGLRTRAVTRVGFPGPRAAGRPPGRWCVPGPGRGPGRGPGDRRGVAGAPVRRVLLPAGLPCWPLPEPGGLGPRLGRRCGGARCRRAVWWRCRTG